MVVLAHGLRGTDHHSCETTAVGSGLLCNSQRMNDCGSHQQEELNYKAQSTFPFFPLGAVWAPTPGDGATYFQGGSFLQVKHLWKHLYRHT